MRIIQLQLEIDMNIPTEVSDEQALKAIGLPKKKWKNVNIAKIKRVYEDDGEISILYDDVWGNITLPLTKNAYEPEPPKPLIIDFTQRSK